LTAAVAVAVPEQRGPMRLALQRVQAVRVPHPRLLERLSPTLVVVAVVVIRQEALVALAAAVPDRTQRRVRQELLTRAAVVGVVSPLPSAATAVPASSSFAFHVLVLLLILLLLLH